jgi:hypothetical protein
MEWNKDLRDSDTKKSKVLEGGLYIFFPPFPSNVTHLYAIIYGVLSPLNRIRIEKGWNFDMTRIST